MKPFLTDPEIIARVRSVEADLRRIIRIAEERPYVRVGAAADALAALARDLEPEEIR